MPYSGDPTSSVLDEVRFLAADTAAEPYLTDAEIGYLLSEVRENVTLAAVRVVEAILQKLAPQACDQSLGPGSISYSQIFGNYQKILATLRQRKGSTGVRAYAGGTDALDMRVRENDPRAVPKQFTTRMFQGRRVPGVLGDLVFPWGR